jgi:hypothetical protein
LTASADQRPATLRTKDPELSCARLRLKRFRRERNPAERNDIYPIGTRVVSDEIVGPRVV